jgi:hypothetical protein
MKNENLQYRVIIDNKVTITFPSEQAALMYVQRTSQRHRKAEFIIEQFEIIFDFQKTPSHKRLLDAFREERFDNSIHASIHSGDSDIGNDDFN